ncbi:MAG: S41 family peptidase [Patescibacteria group bacterium]|mgnify:CR=1 FL=1
MVVRRVFLWFLVVLAVVSLLGSGFLFGLRIGEKNPKTIIIKGVSNMESSEVNVDFGTFWQAWSLINEEYLKAGDISGEKKTMGAIEGLVKSLGDPYSEFFSPEDNKKFREDIQGNFGGIGAELGIKDGVLIVVAPLKDTPASRAGLMAGDQILEVNSTSTSGIAIDNAVSMIRGPEGTEVVLTVLRDGWDESKEFKITRGNIVIPTLETETVGGNIAHVKLYTFNANAEAMFYEAVLNSLYKGDKGMILDLRNNPGGYLEVAVGLAGWFLPRGTLVVSEKGRGEEIRREFRANGNAALANFPVVVLVNKGSASASEILAGALRDQRKIKLVGETTFGKGTIQNLEDLQDGSSMKITVAHWVLPDGHILEGNGLVPDVEAEMTEEDMKNKRDPQLDKAVEVIKSQT